MSAQQLMAQKGNADGETCAHPCRWKYSIVEESRPGKYMPVYENERERVYLIQRIYVVD